MIFWLTITVRIYDRYVVVQKESSITDIAIIKNQRWGAW